MILVPALRAGKPYQSKVVILLRDYATRTSRTREIFLKRCISSARFNAYRSLLRAPWPDRPRKEVSIFSAMPTGR